MTLNILYTHPKKNPDSHNSNNRDRDEEFVQDYPSISHINSVVQANSFILLFGVIKSYINIYQVLLPLGVFTKEQVFISKMRHIG